MGAPWLELDDLDDTLLVRLFDFLDPLPDLFSVARVCLVRNEALLLGPSHLHETAFY